MLCHGWSPAGGAQQNWEGGRPVGGIDPQKHSVGCLHGASKFGELVPLGVLAGGWEREMALDRAFIPRGAEFCLPGLNTSPSWYPLALPLSEQSC